MKKIIIKGFLIFLITGVAFSVFAAGQEEAKEKATIWAQTTHPQQLPALKKVIDDFEKAWPGYKAKVEQIPWGNAYEKWATGLAAGTAPDIIIPGPSWAIEWAGMGALADITDYFVKDKEMLDDLYPGMLEQCKLDNRYFGVPPRISMLTLVYNKDMLAKEGLPTTLPEKWTWEEFTEYLVKVTKDTDADGKIDQWGFSTSGQKASSWTPRFFATLWGYGGKLFSEDKKKCLINSPGGIKSAELWSNWVSKGVITPGFIQFSSTDARQMYYSGKTAFLMDGQLYYKNVVDDKEKYKFEPGMGLIPSSTGKSVVGLETSPIVITKVCKHKDAAWGLVRLFMLKETMEDYCSEMFRLPARMSIDLGKLYSAYPDMKIAGKQLKMGRAVPLVSESPQIMSIILANYQAIWTGEKSIKKALDDAVIEANKLLSK